MIKITYTLQDDHFSLKIDGHAGYAQMGKDIVCAGVSALTFALAEYISNHCIEYTIHVDKMPVTMCAIGDKAVAAFDMAMTGYTQIANTYPDYVSIEEKVPFYQEGMW